MGCTRPRKAWKRRRILSLTTARAKNHPPADGPTGSDPGRIECTEATWNPVTGCTQVSPGCKPCYTERLAKRLKAMGSPRYRNGFRVTLHEDVVDQPNRCGDGGRSPQCGGNP